MTTRADAIDPAVARLLDGLGDDSILSRIGRGPDVETIRREFAETFGADRPAPVGDTERATIDGGDGPIEARLQRPDRVDGPLLVFLHGGGFVLGDLESSRTAVNGLVRRGIPVLTVDYRLAPEHPFPAALLDVQATLRWAAGRVPELDATGLAVGGDSAGGTLATAASILARDRGGVDLDHQVLCYPMVRSPVEPTTDSLEENARGYLLETRAIEWFADQYVDRPVDHRNGYAWPSLVGALEGLPPATVVTAGFDPLRDEGIAYADRLREAGVPVDHAHYPAMIHGFLDFGDRLPVTGECLDRIAARLRS